jgi:hypothetical protein
VTGRARSNVAAALTALAAGCIAVAGAGNQDHTVATDADQVSTWQLQRAEDLVAKLCAHGADQVTCADAGLSPLGARYVVTGRGPTIRYAEPAPR